MVRQRKHWSCPALPGMRDGKIVRFEEITRTPLEVQDCLLGMLSDRVMTVPELTGEASQLYAREGFNIIATANTRDRGVNEMSAALKRRFDFETVFPIMDFAQELELVASASARCWPIAAFRIKCLTRYWSYWSAPFAICVPTAKRKRQWIH